MIADCPAVDVLFATRFFNEYLKSIDVEHPRFIFKRGGKIPILLAKTEGKD